ncbi:MAG: PAS domain-containing protein [Bacteriovoracaceae bacterium]|nr:PAS domain-containing protein [Bacteriovoracaceae bacterium]
MNQNKKYMRLSFISSLLFLIACMLTANYYLSEIVESLAGDYFRDSFSHRVDVAQGLAVYQNELIKTQGKSRAKAIDDFIETIKLTSGREKSIHSDLFIGRVVGRNKLETLYYSGEMAPDDSFLIRIKKKFDFDQFHDDRSLIRSQGVAVYTHTFSPWNLILLSGTEQKVYDQAIGRVTTAINLFFLFLTILIVMIAGILVFLFYKQWQKRELNSRKEQMLFDCHPDQLMLLSKSGIILDVSKGVLDEIRMENDEVKGSVAWGNYWWSHSEVAQNQIRESIDAVFRGEKAEFTAAHPTATGDTLSITHKIVPIHNGKGEVAFALDLGISDKLAAMKEKNAEDHDSIFKYFFENTPDAILVHGLHSGIISVNAAALQMFSIFESSELKGHTLIDFSPDFQGPEEESVVLINEIFSKTMVVGSCRTNWRLRDFKGVEHHVELSLFRGQLSCEQVLFISIKDIQEEKIERDESEAILTNMKKTIDEQNEVISSQSGDLFRAMSELDTLMGRVIADDRVEPGADLLHIINDAVKVAFEKYDDQKITLNIVGEFDQSFSRESYPMRVRGAFSIIADHCFNSIFTECNSGPKMSIEIKSSPPYNIISFTDNRSSGRSITSELMAQLRTILSKFGGDLSHSDSNEHHRVEVLLPINDDF